MGLCGVFVRSLERSGTSLSDSCFKLRIKLNMMNNLESSCHSQARSESLRWIYLGWTRAELHVSWTLCLLSRHAVHCVCLGSVFVDVVWLVVFQNMSPGKLVHQCQHGEVLHVECGGVRPDISWFSFTHCSIHQTSHDCVLWACEYEAPSFCRVSDQTRSWQASSRNPGMETEIGQTGWSLSHYLQWWLEGLDLGWVETSLFGSMQLWGIERTVSWRIRCFTLHRTGAKFAPANSCAVPLAKVFRNSKMVCVAWITFLESEFYQLVLFVLPFCVLSFQSNTFYVQIHQHS